MWLGDAEIRPVILINLLPHREAARKRRKEAFFASLAGAQMCGGFGFGAVLIPVECFVRHLSDITSDSRAKRQQQPLEFFQVSFL